MARSRPVRYVFSHTISSRRSPSKSRNIRSLWLKLPSRLKSLCRTANGAKAPSSLVHTGTGPARSQVGCFFFFFIIEPHQCFRCCANSVMKFLPRYVTDEYLAEHWPELIQGKPFATIHAALQAASRPGYNIAIVRLAGPVSQRNDAYSKVSATVAEHLLANYSFDQSKEIRQGREVHGRTTLERPFFPSFPTLKMDPS